MAKKTKAKAQPRVSYAKLKAAHEQTALMLHQANHINEILNTELAEFKAHNHKLAQQTMQLERDIAHYKDNIKAKQKREGLMRDRITVLEHTLHALQMANTTAGLEDDDDVASEPAGFAGFQPTRWSAAPRKFNTLDEMFKSLKG